MKTIRILILCMLASYGFAQQRLNKTSQSIKVDKDAKIDLNTSYVEIEIDTWNKDIVEIEAYIESDKLSKDELQKVLNSWKLNVAGSNDKVVISTQAGSSYPMVIRGSYDELLRDLEFELADVPEIPEIPEMVEMPEMPEMMELPEIPEMPKMPEFPELPELPKGVTTITFDYDKYQKEGEKYLAEWSKRYEKEGGKELQKEMEAWARKFGESDYQKDMQKWGEEYAKRFDGKWAKEMEAWGEKFGEDYAKEMEVWGEKFGKQWAEKMEAWGENLAKRMERQAARWERLAEGYSEKETEKAKRQAALNRRKVERAVAAAERQAELIERQAQLQARQAERKAEIEARMAQREDEVAKLRQLREKNKALLRSGSDYEKSSKVRKVIKLKIPKKAKLNMNVRHGELKISSVLYDLQGDISHSFLIADYIDGGETSINVSYSPVVVDTWKDGVLNLNFVERAQINNANSLVLNSKSSNIVIEDLNETGIIDGSFGDLTISNLSESFKTLNLVLENSDALINLPENVGYNMYYKGSRSKLNNKLETQKTIKNNPDGKTTDRTIMVNAKFSSIIMN